MKSLIEKTSDKLVNAFLQNKIIKPIPSKFTKKLKEAQKLRILCESKIKHPVIGFKAAGTGIPLIKKFKEKEPFYASVYKRNFLKSGKKVKINFVKDRPGHDIRYALNSNKIKTKLGWSPKINFKKGIKLTLDWYFENKSYYKSLSKKDIINRLGKG